jgi:DNA-binding response OmpR family regulator
MILTEHGYDVSTYESPAFAQAIGVPDLVVSDNRMPHVTGMEYVRRLLHDGCMVRHIALMSGDWDYRDIHEAEAMGCKIFHKPFSMGALQSWLNTLPDEPATDPERTLCKSGAQM